MIYAFFENFIPNLLMLLDLFKSSLSRKTIIVQNEQKAIESDEEKLSKLHKELKDRNSLLNRAKEGTRKKKLLLKRIKEANEKNNTILINI